MKIIFLFILLPIIYYYGKYIYIMNSPNMGVPVNWDCNKADMEINRNSTKIFLGVFTKEDNYNRRQIIRDTYLKNKSNNVIFKFITGRPTTKKFINEIKEYHDILPLDIKENMNKGKTYEYFYTIAEIFNNYNLDFVIKADDDSYIRLDLMEKDLNTTNNKMSYWGYLVGNTFMGGECYGLSFDLVKWIHNSNITRKNKYGHEDSQVQKWFVWDKINNNITYETRNCVIHDEITSNTVYSKNISKKSMVVHYIKKDKIFIDVHYKISKYLLK